jgi:hypothetical protein
LSQATLSLLQSITEPSLLAFILRQLKHATPLMAPFPKVIDQRLLQEWEVVVKIEVLDSDYVDDE